MSWEDLGFSASARHLAYPMGRQDREVVLPLVREAFASARLASGGVETLPPADWHLLRAVNVLPTTSPEEPAALIRDAGAHGEWVILMFRHLVESPRGDTEYALSDFQQLVGLVVDSGVEVRTVDEVWRRFGDGAEAVE